jgi:hypothetical protein
MLVTQISTSGAFPGRHPAAYSHQMGGSPAPLFGPKEFFRASNE